MTAAGAARVLAHTPGRGRGGTAADLGITAEDAVTAPNTSKCRKTAYTVHTACNYCMLLY